MVARTGKWGLSVGGYGKRAFRHPIMKLASAAVRGAAGIARGQAGEESDER